MQRNIVIAIIILIPVLISGYVSYLIINRDKPQPPTASTQPSQLPLATPTLPIVIDGLTFPSANATPQEIDTFYQSALTKAQDTSVITLSSCNPTPQFTKVAPSQKITMKNTDKSVRTITLAADKKYSIPAQGETVITMNFNKGVGTYGYHCDDSSKIVGVLVITTNDSP